MANKSKPPSKSKRPLEQQGVLILRPNDQFMVVQNGQQKLMLVAAFVQALADMTTQTVGTMAVAAHTHPEGDIVGLTADIAALAAAIAGKAPTNHVHNIADIHGNFIDATQTPAVVYNGAYPVTAKATVAGGNAVFQFTDTGLAGGNSLFPTGPLPNSEQFRAEEGTNPHAFGIATWSNSNKTLTVPVSKTGAALVVLGLSVLAANVAANGSVIYATAWGR